MRARTRPVRGCPKIPGREESLPLAERQPPLPPLKRGVKKATPRRRGYEEAMHPAGLRGFCSFLPPCQGGVGGVAFPRSALPKPPNPPCQVGKKNPSLCLGLTFAFVRHSGACRNPEQTGIPNRRKVGKNDKAKRQIQKHSPWIPGNPSSVGIDCRNDGNRIQPCRRECRGRIHATLIFRRPATGRMYVGHICPTYKTMIPIVPPHRLRGLFQQTLVRGQTRVMNERLQKPLTRNTSSCKTSLFGRF